MTISAIVAMSENRVIGKDNRIPWHLPADLQYFKKITLGKPIIMGRRTHESIGRPLPERCNIIITRDHLFQAPGCVVTYDIESALASAEYSEEFFIIGGASLYRDMLPRIQRLYLTMVHHQFDGDIFFPELDLSEWNQVSCEDHTPDEKNKYAYSFMVLERK